MRSRTFIRPVRVGLTPTPVIRRREPGSSVAATRNGAVEEKSPGIVSRSGSSRSAGRTSTCPGEARTDAPAAREHPLGVVSRRDGLDHRRRTALGEQPREQDARLHLSARNGELVAHRGAVNAPRYAAAGRRRSSPPSRPSASADRRFGPSAAATATRLRRARSACRPGRRGSRRRAERACRRCRSRPVPPARAVRAGPHPRRARCPRPPPPRRRARGRPRPSTRCRPSGRSPRSRVSPSAIAPSSTARCETDLSPGTAMPPCTDPAGSMFIRLRARPTRRSPAPRAAAPPARPPTRRRPGSSARRRGRERSAAARSPRC